MYINLYVIDRVLISKYIVYDEHKFDTLGYYLANKEEIESDHKKRVRNGCM
jgi:hypothetical protein